jgi:hypothetical protein
VVDPRLKILNVRPISSWSYPRILVGIPIERAISYADKVFHQFLQIAMNGPSIARLPYGRVDVVRNKLATELLTSTYSHVLMLDIDHIHPSDIIQRMAANVILDPSIKVLSGWNYRRGKPYDPIPAMRDEHGRRLMIETWEPGLIKVDEVGGGSLLVHRSVFEEMEPPWFFNIYDKIWENDYPGEDIGFSRKCNHYGIKMYADTTITSPHCIEGTVTEETFRRYWATHKNDEALHV